MSYTVYNAQDALQWIGIYAVVMCIAFASLSWILAMLNKILDFIERRWGKR